MLNRISKKIRTFCLGLLAMVLALGAKADLITYDPATESISWDFSEYLSMVFDGLSNVFSVIALVVVVAFCIGLLFYATTKRKMG